MNSRLHTLFILLFCILPLQVFPNAAQPGFWNAGGTGTFSLLYPDDLEQFQKIQMVKERVSIQLYKGYAVVKGEYWMYNDMKDPIRIKVGYPLNSSYTSKSHNFEREAIRFDLLYALKVYSNDQSMSYASETHYTEDRDRPDSWYTWENIFTPGDTTKITVYFIVNTNNTIIREGYNTDASNGFIYLLETGANWKQPIEEGEIRIQLKDELSMEDVIGISPDSIFKINEDQKIILTRFYKLSPTPANNIIIAYSEQVEHFNFSKVVAGQEDLYKQIDSFSASIINSSTLSPQKFDDPFEVHSTNWLVGIFIIFVFFAPFWLGLGVVVFIIILIVKRIKKNKLSA